MYPEKWGVPHQNHDYWLSKDYGPLQINDHFHEAEMKQLNLNILKWEDSLYFGFILLSTQGLQPWSASKSCWSKSMI